MTQEATTARATFPSVEWFNAIREIVNAVSDFHARTWCDLFSPTEG